MGDPRTLGLRVIVTLLSLGALLAPNSASATYLVDWHFDNPVQTVGPFDSVTMLATLVNNSTGGEHVIGADVTQMTYFFGNTSPAYSFNFGSFSQFSGLDLAPGDSFGFTFGMLTPSAPPVPTGVYVSPESDLKLRGVDINAGRFVVEVTGVPEPTSLIMLAGGLLGLARRRRTSWP